MTYRIIDELRAAAKQNLEATPRDQKANQITAAATEQAQLAIKQLERAVLTHPVAAIGVAIAAGVVLGWWVKRK